MGGTADGRTGGRAWTSEQVANALSTSGPSGLVFASVATDSRQPIPDALFVALKGERFDAHHFLAQAKAQGAAAAVVRRGTPAVSGLPFFEVADTLVALGQLANARRRALPAGSPVVAITGSSGKTSTKEMIRVALSPKYRVHATSANLNNLVGVPLTILGAPQETDALAVEAGASVPGEIARLRDIIEPTVAVVTTVGYAHTEGFGSLAGVMREKLSLLEGSPAPFAVVGSEPAELYDEARRRASALRVTVERPDLDETGHPRLRVNGGDTITLPVLGVHQLENALIALAVAERVGVPRAAAARALATVRLPAGRGEIRTIDGLLVIDDSYNANPGSLRRALDLAAWVAGRQRRPLAVVVGSMLELGPESARLHAEAARDVLARRPALVAAVGDFVPAFAALGDPGAARVIHAPDAAALGPALQAALRGTEVVLLKASRGVALERVLKHLT